MNSFTNTLIASLWALCIAILVSVGHNCPPKGDSSNLEHQQFDLLKNRAVPSKKRPIIINLKTLFTGKNDSTKFDPQEWASVTGYIELVKPGGQESCNCHSKVDSMEDWHIELCPTPTLDKRKVMVCEITRFSRSFTGITYKELEGLKGQLVTITGFCLFDKEHWQNSFNSNPTGKDIWRGTANEIHPAFKVEQ